MRADETTPLGAPPRDDPLRGSLSPRERGRAAPRAVVAAASSALLLALAALATRASREAGLASVGFLGAAPCAEWSGSSCDKYLEDEGVCRVTTDYVTESCLPEDESLSLDDWKRAFYACIDGSMDGYNRPYLIPAEGRPKTSFLAEYRARLRAPERAGATAPAKSEAWTESSDPRRRAGSAYAWVYLHIPKSGGTYFSELIRAHLLNLREKNGLGPHPEPEGFFFNPAAWPMHDVTEDRMRHTLKHFKEGDPPEQMSAAGMAELRVRGQREMMRGALAMGACDVVQGTCAYITMLREPVDRLLSHYAYKCLEGQEKFSGWTQEMKDKGVCDVDPVTYFQGSESLAASVNVLAPRADPMSWCAVETAKKNLANPCTRFLLMDRMEEGIEKLRTHYEDFEDFGVVPDSFRRIAHGRELEMKNGSGSRLSEEGKRRLEAYKANATMMDELRHLARYDTALYEYALTIYDKQWERDVHTC